MWGMMQQMMSGESASKGMSGMGDRMGMRAQMSKMMGQCTAMMGAGRPWEDPGKEE